jgi:hypothetical protein
MEKAAQRLRYAQERFGEQIST